jgi:hypothetical protein
MDIVLNDSRGVLSFEQTQTALNRLALVMARFNRRINRIAAHFSLNESGSKYTSTIQVSLEGSGILTIQKTGSSIDDLIKVAMNAVENKVAFRVDWHAWVNIEKFATFVHALKISIRKVVAPLYGVAPAPSSGQRLGNRRKPQIQIKKDQFTFFSN